MRAESFLREHVRSTRLDDALRDCGQAIGVSLPVAVINLAQRTDRWEAVASRMASIGLDKVTRMAAVEGARLDLGEIASLLAQPIAQIEAPPPDHFTLTRPAIGCFLSHLAIWQWLIDNDVPQMLVLEDDASPAPGFDAHRFRDFMGMEPREGFVLLGRIIMDGLAELTTPVERGAALGRIYFFNGTFAYLITPALARALMEHLLPLDGHIDHQISTTLVRRRKEIAAYYTEPAFFEPDWSLRSDCYVPLTDTENADRDLGALFAASRRLLRSEGRPLLPPYGRQEES